MWGNVFDKWSSEFTFYLTIDARSRLENCSITIPLPEVTIRTSGTYVRWTDVRNLISAVTVTANNELISHMDNNTELWYNQFFRRVNNECEWSEQLQSMTVILQHPFFFSYHPRASYGSGEATRLEITYHTRSNYLSCLELCEVNNGQQEYRIPTYNDLIISDVTNVITTLNYDMRHYSRSEVLTFSKTYDVLTFYNAISDNNGWYCLTPPSTIHCESKTYRIDNRDDIVLVGIAYLITDSYGNNVSADSISLDVGGFIMQKPAELLGKKIPPGLTRYVPTIEGCYIILFGEIFHVNDRLPNYCGINPHRNLSTNSQSINPQSINSYSQSIVRTHIGHSIVNPRIIVQGIYWKKRTYN